MTDIVDFRALQLARDQELWPPRTRKRLLSNHPDYSRIYSAYRHCVLVGEFDHLEQFVDPTKVCVDVGANMGQYSLKLSTLARACLSIEPLNVYGFLRDLLPDNCTFLNLACGKTPGQQKLFSPRAADGVIHFGLSSMIPDHFPGEFTYREQMTEIQPLDSLVEQIFPEQPVGFIKIDVEGYELDVLEGCQKTLERDHPNLQVEIDDENLAAVSRFLSEFQYRGLFYFRRQLVDLARFRKEIHRANENAWSPERQSTFDRTLYVSNFFFIP